MKAKLCLMVATILMMICLVSVKYEVPEIEYTEGTVYEDAEVKIFCESNFSFYRRIVTEDYVMYDVIDDGSKNLKDELNILSTNLYLNWYAQGYDYKIYIAVVNRHNKEQVVYLICNGKEM